MEQKNKEVNIFPRPLVPQVPLYHEIFYQIKVSIIRAVEKTSKVAQNFK